METCTFKKWLISFNLPAEKLELCGRLVADELIDMDQPNVSEACRNLRLKLRGCKWPGSSFSNARLF